VKPNGDPRTKGKSRILMFLVVGTFLGVLFCMMERKEKKLLCVCRQAAVGSPRGI
jgi:hypothetical protein